MEDEGIEDGDLVVIRQDPDPKEGDLVIALDEENRNTLKKYGGKDRKTRKIILEYCNKAVYGDKKILVKHLVCQGVVSHIMTWPKRTAKGNLTAMKQYRLRYHWTGGRAANEMRQVTAEKSEDMLCQRRRALCKRGPVV